MRIAAIDIGSNTVRLLIGDVEGARVRPIRYERELTRLASGMAEGRMLAAEPMRRTFDALARFLRLIEEEGVSHVIAAGTSAIREASNSNELIEMVRGVLGLEIRTLDDEQEALTTAMGVLDSFHGVASALILDIGGGSTEAVAYNDGSVRGSISLPVGVVKLSDRHLKSDPPSEGNLTWLEAEAAGVALSVHERLSVWLPEGSEFISTAGTPTTIAAIDLGLGVYDAERVHGHLVSIEKLEELYARLAALSNTERLAIKGMEPGREDLIIPGIILTIKLMEAFSFDSMRVSDRGLLDGLLRALAGELGLL